jgi:hypothetical protein
MTAPVSTTEVCAALGGVPSSPAVVGMAILRERGIYESPAMYEGMPKFLSSHGISVSRIRKSLELLEAEGRAVRVPTGDGRTLGWISVGAHARRLERELAEDAKRRQKVLLQRAEAIVLSRHGREVAAVLAELEQERA